MNVATVRMEAAGILRIQALLIERRDLKREKYRLKFELNSTVDATRYRECRVRIGLIRDRCDIIMEQLKRTVDELVLANS